MLDSMYQLHSNSEASFAFNQWCCYYLIYTYLKLQLGIIVRIIIVPSCRQKDVNKLLNKQIVLTILSGIFI